MKMFILLVTTSDEKYTPGLYKSSQEAKDDIPRVFSDFIDDNYDGDSERITKVIPVDELSEVLERKYDNICCVDKDSAVVYECNKVDGYFSTSVIRKKLSLIEVVPFLVHSGIRGKTRKFKNKLSDTIENRKLPEEKIATQTKAEPEPFKENLKSAVKNSKKKLPKSVIGSGNWDKSAKNGKTVWVKNDNFKERKFDISKSPELVEGLNKRRKVLGESQINENE